MTLKYIKLCKNMIAYFFFINRQSGAVVREAGGYTKGPGYESWVRHGYQIVRPWPRQWLHDSAL